jgi:hypothetical protein
MGITHKTKSTSKSLFLTSNIMNAKKTPFYVKIFMVTHNDAKKTNAERKKRRRPKLNKAKKTRPTELARMIIPVRGRRPKIKTVKAENGRINPRNKAERVVFLESP